MSEAFAELQHRDEIHRQLKSKVEEDERVKKDKIQIGMTSALLCIFQCENLFTHSSSVMVSYRVSEVKVHTFATKPSWRDHHTRTQDQKERVGILRWQKLKSTFAFRRARLLRPMRSLLKSSSTTGGKQRQC